MKTILIFGVNSFTGKHFQEYVKQKELNKNYLFIGVDKKSDLQNNNFKFEEIEILSKGVIKDILVKHKPEYIVNLVGFYGKDDFDTFFNINTLISKNILDAIIECKQNVEKILFIGTAAEYGEPKNLPVKETSLGSPVNFYGLTKLMQTDIVKYYANNFNLPICVARTFNIIGNGISESLSIGSFLKQIKNLNNGDEMKVGNIESKRDFLDISDVIDAYWKLLILATPDVYNVCKGKSISMKEILELMINESKKNINFVFHDSFKKINDVSDIYGDNSKIIKETGWQPNVNIDESVKKLFNNKTNY